MAALNMRQRRGPSTAPQCTPSTDDAAGELIHEHQHPVAVEHDGYREPVGPVTRIDSGPETMDSSLEGIVRGIEGGHMMRDGALARLRDANLQFSPGGDNVTLGHLLKEMGEIEVTYIRSLKTGKQDWSYRNDEDGLADSTARLGEWFGRLDRQMKQVLDQLTHADLQKPIDRSHGAIRTVEAQLDIYVQAQLIFLGKLVVYFKAMGTPLPNSIQQYIA